MRVWCKSNSKQAGSVLVKAMTLALPYIKLPEFSDNLAMHGKVIFVTSCTIMNQLSDMFLKSRNAFVMFLGIQATSYAATVGTWKPKTRRVVRNIFLESIAKKPEIMDKYLDTVEAVEATPWTIPFLSFLLTAGNELQMSDKVASILPQVLNKYVEVMFLAKSQIPPHLLKSGSALLALISHDQFVDKVLSGMKRASLRTPELAVTAFNEAIACLSIDLSRYVKDFLDIFGPLLASPNALLHEGAEKCFASCISDVSDSTAITSLVDGIFKILEGCHGKIAAYQHRVIILKLTQKLSNFNSSGQSASETIIEHAITKYQAFMKIEQNETVQIECINSLAHWGCKAKVSVSKSTIELFKVGFVKGATAHTRIAYLRAADQFFEGDTLSFLEILEDTLLGVVDKVASTNVLSIAEGFAAGYLLLKLAHKDLGDGEAILSKIKEKLLTENVVSLLSSKVLPAVHDIEVTVFVHFIRTIVMNFQVPIGENTTEMMISTLLDLILMKSYPPTKMGMTAIQGILQSDENLAYFIIDYLNNNASTYTKTDDSPYRSLKFVEFTKEIFAIIASLSKGTRESCLDNSLLMLHSPNLAPENVGLFKDIADVCRIDLYKYGEEHQEELMEIIQANLTPQCYALVSSLCQHCLTLITPLFCMCLDFFERHALKEITNNDLEIHRTPSGTLWKTSLLEEFEKSVVVDKNVKRESKLYSVEDQKWAVDMEAKLKKQEGMKLTKKQQDDLAARIAVEEDIRSHVEGLKKEFTHKFNIIMSCLNANIVHIMHSIARVSSVTIAILTYPLTAKRASDLLIKLSLKVFPCKELGFLLGRLTVRLHDPPCVIDPDWLGEPIDKAFTRCISQLQSMLDTGFTLSSASFALAFSFLRYIVQKTAMTEESYEENALVALDFVLTHLKKRATPDNLFDGPTFMPMEDLLQMSCETFERKPVGQVGLRLLAVLHEVCKASNGDPGCAIAGEGEVGVLVKYMASPNDVLRVNILQGLLVLKTALSVLVYESSDVNGLSNKLCTAAWMAKFDVVPAVQNAGLLLWNETMCNFRIHPGICDGLLVHIVSCQDHLQIAASQALSNILEDLDDSIDDILEKLMNLYIKKSDIPGPVLDEMGRVIFAAPADKWEERVGIADALVSMVPLLINEQLLNLISLIVPRGLSDQSPDVQARMRDVGIMVINIHGKLVIDVLLPVFENYLDNTADSKSSDVVKQNVVILMATLAKHLKQDDPKVKPIVCKLMESLATPSEQVQVAVAECLAPLVPAIKDLAPQLVQRILYQLLESEKYGERRGAAYGLAGLVKGLGLLSLKQLEIMPTLIEAIQNKKNFKHREGALMAFEQLCTMMGTLFEPYVINVLPHLLVCFGDSNQYVREATEKASKAIMAKLSGHGVKLVLPSLLKALTDDAWRTKAGSVELLGAMAYCNPKQLSSCLPNIVPKLIEVMADSHTKVQKASQAALKQIGSVIRNPEIQAIVHLLLNALSDPSRHTDSCLNALMKTSFVHKIDAPSLALIVPVLVRSFEQRTDTKKSAAQIIGNMLVLTDEKDLKPYLDSVIPGIKSALLDPVPDVRLYSARALGSLVKGIGEIPDLMDWMLEMLVSEQSSVDRSGAAQGISEVMIGLGPDRLEKTMEEILICLEDESLLPHIRDGYLLLFIYFPITMKEEFSSYIGSILTPILSGLASESEFVRQTSYKAGQRIVQQYADSAINLFLPRLEQGLFDDNHRIRLASCQLLGDLLYKIMGVTGKQSTVTGDEDDNFGTDETKRLIIGILGEDRRNRVFSGLYMARSDVALAVRQAGLHIWKIVVTNTPKTLKEILPVMMELILGCLASESYDKRMVASRTLGDLVKKLSDRILPEVVPILEAALKTQDIVQRQGVCLGLSEIVSATSKEQVELYSDSLLPAIRTALTDPCSEVRNAAAGTFAALHNVLGTKALDEILSPLLSMMETMEGEESEYLIGALQEIMQAKSRVVLPYMVPKLIQKPVNIGALASLSSVAGTALYEHLDTIITAIIEGLCEVDETEISKEMEHANLIISSIEETDGHENTLEILEEMLKSEDAKIRLHCSKLFETFAQNEHLEVEEHITIIWQALLLRFSDPDPEVVKNCWNAFNLATKRLASGDQVKLVPDLKMAVYLAVDAKHRRDPTYTLPGFCLPKGLATIVALYREGILNGSPELKEQAISGLKEAISWTNQLALKPSVVQITGPLIRVLGERYTPSIKIACLDTLSLLIDKVKVALKPFLSQLQTTFMKSLNDGTREVREKGVTALTKLVTLHNRVDNLFTDIHHGTKNENLTTRETMFAALQGTMFIGGANMSPNLALSISVTLTNHIGAPEDTIRTVNGACIGSLATFFSDEELDKLIRENIIPQGQTKETKHGRVLAIAGLLRYAPDRMSKMDLIDEVTSSILTSMESDNVSVCNAANYAGGQLMIHLLNSGENAACLVKLVSSLAKNCGHNSSNDVRSFATNMVHMINISGAAAMSDEYVKCLIIPLIDNTTMKVPQVRGAAEVAIATLLRLRDSDDIVGRISPSLDPKSLEIFNRFLPSAKRVAADQRTYTGHENNIFSFLCQLK